MRTPGRGWQTLAAALNRLAVAVIVAVIAVYKVTLSPLLGRHCRFEPTCSRYFREAVEKHGALRGSLKGIARLCRCHPWHPGGYDPP
jgi:putative membrane protein insertion efficiency factor